MKYIPILYSTPMVLAKLDDRKTVTRRLNGLEELNKNPDDFQFEWADFALDKPWRFTQKSTVNEKTLADQSFNQIALKCPYGQSGDILWGRETLYQNGELGIEYYADKEAIDEVNVIPEDYGPYGGEYSFRQIPSIHMPKWACRIFDKVIKIRVERLQKITEADAIAEGILKGEPQYKNFFPGGIYNLPPISSYKSLWATINGDNSWDHNPWVWVIETEQIEKPENFI